MNIHKAKKEFLPTVISGAIIGAHYGNSMVWAAIGSISGVVLPLLAQWVDKNL